MPPSSSRTSCRPSSAWESTSKLVEGVGPVVEEPIDSAAAVERLRVAEPEEWAAPILEAVRLVRARARARTGARRLLRRSVHRRRLPRRRQAEPRLRAHEGAHVQGTGDLARADGAADASSSHATSRRWRTAGADAIQLFDSWVGVLSVADYREFVAPYSARVLEAAGVPTIHFGTGTTTQLLAEMAVAGGSAIGVDWRIPLDDAWTVVGEIGRSRETSSRRCCSARGSGSSAAALDVLRRAAGRPGHVFNLGHGVLPQTDPDVLTRLADLVRSYGQSMKSAVVLMAYGSPERLADVPRTTPTSAAAGRSRPSTSPTSSSATGGSGSRTRRRSTRSPRRRARRSRPSSVCRSSPG